MALQCIFRQVSIEMHLYGGNINVSLGDKKKTPQSMRIPSTNFALDIGRTRSCSPNGIPSVRPASAVIPAASEERLPWRRSARRQGSPDTEQNFVIGRLSEDGGDCRLTNGSQAHTGGGKQQEGEGPAQRMTL